MPSRCLVILTLLNFCSQNDSRAEDAQNDPHYAKQIAPILERHCLKCHKNRPRAGLDLSTKQGVLTGADNSPVLVPGKPKQSLLIQVLSKDAEPHMPPRGQLTEKEITALSHWIERLPASTVVGSPIAKGSDHWAFQPVQRPALPEVKDPSWIRTPVDAFVLARLEQANLSPSSAAKKETLLRRVYFDLIGLPPSPDEIHEFMEDDSPDSYERIVDQLLVSPRYGERWGRHWLDLARYADSSGFHQDFDRPSAWRYRDYVIDAFNKDKPYSRFVEEQLAGDLLPDATVESWIATGFGRNGPSNDDNMGKGLAKEKYRMDQLDDVVSTTSNVFLGLTLGCARCHDHKYDPLAQRDYYQFLAYFDSTTPQRLVLSDFQRDKPELRPHSSKRDKLTPISARVLTDRGQKKRTTHVLWRGDLRNLGPKVQANVPDVLRTKDTSQTESRLTLARWITNAKNPLTWRVMANRIWAHHFGRGLVASPSNLGLRSERPTHPKLLDWLATELRHSGGSVKELHRLIVTSSTYRQTSQVVGDSDPGAKLDPDNRLLWRMRKRRLESEPLRDAILATSGNLNLTMGGYGVKPRIRPELLVASQRNKWPVVKKEGPEHWRRSVYVYVKRQLQLPFLELFDAPTTTHSCARRSQTLVPTQSLVLMNDEFVIEQAGYFADRVIREAGPDLHSQIGIAMERALGRKASSSRIETAVAFVTHQARILKSEGRKPEQAQRDALADFCQVLFNLSEFVHVD